MGHCQSSCCPPSDDRPPKKTNGHTTMMVASPSVAPSAQRSSAIGGRSDNTSAVSRYRADTRETGDHSKDITEANSDVRKSTGHVRSVIDTKTHSELPRPHSDRQIAEKKRTASDGGLEMRANALFEFYRDSVEDDCILESGIERLCNDLSLEPEDFQVLVLAWQCNAQTMCRLTRAEFVTGCKRLKADTVPGISGRLPDIADDVRRDPTKFRDLYRWAYGFALDSSTLQRNLPLSMAVPMWRLVFTGSESTPKVLPRWIDFLEKRTGDVRAIPRDTWDMFLAFVETVGDDLGSYDDSEAWPSLLDDFVEFENDRRNQNLFVDISDKE